MKNYLFGILIIFPSILFGQINPSDGCSGIPVLTQNSSCITNSYNLPGSYNNGGLVTASCAAGLNRDDGWYQFTATATTTDIDLTGNRNHLVSVWTGCASGTELACDYAAAGTTASVSFSTTIGTTYYIQVQRRQSNNGASMNGDICIREPYDINNDCDSATQVCTDLGFPGNSSGFGVQELDASNRGCLAGNEHESSWYLINIGTSGTLQFTISPSNGSDDYDFAVWGPNETCPPSTTPIRCSWAAGGGNTGVNTGLNGGSPETSEGSGGDRYVDDMNVLAGEYYTLLVDNYTSSSSPFDFTFGGSAGISCVPLPVELYSFQGHFEEGANVLTWITKSESNNAYYSVEHSVDGINWNLLGNYEGAGNSSKTLEYTYKDYNFIDGLNYYRLYQTDFDGKRVLLGSVSIYNGTQGKEVIRILNTMGQEVDDSYSGVKIYYYKDGSVEKKMRLK